VTSSLQDPPVRPGETLDSCLVLDIALAAGDDAAALRVLSLLARRRCRLRRASLALAPAVDRPHLQVELTVPRGREATVVRWVAGLISVRRVDRHDP
jgi:hypothetical protein